MPKYTLPIVGMHFRPPAKAFTQTMPMQQELFLLREPENQYDPNAIMVGIAVENLPKEGPQAEVFWEDLLAISTGMGFDRDAIEAEEVFQLGYIPRTEAETLAAAFDEHGCAVIGQFGYDSAGKPVVTFDPEEYYESEDEDEDEV